MRVGIDVLACRKLAKRHMRIGMSHQEPYWCQLPLKKKKRSCWEAVKQPLQKEQSSFVDIITSINSTYMYVQYNINK